MEKKDDNESATISPQSSNVHPLLTPVMSSEPIKIDRKRSSSESSNSGSNNLNIMDNILSNNCATGSLENDDVTMRPARSGFGSWVQRKATSLIFSDAITRKFEEDLMSRSLQNISLEENKLASSDGLHDIEFPEAEARKTSQTDHLNKRLLDSFLDRINSISTAIPLVDPDVIEGNRGIYTDDLLMDKILHRVESESKK